MIIVQKDWHGGIIMCNCWGWEIGLLILKCLSDFDNCRMCISHSDDKHRFVRDNSKMRTGNPRQNSVQDKMPRICLKCFWKKNSWILSGITYRNCISIILEVKRPQFIRNEIFAVHLTESTENDSMMLCLYPGFLLQIFVRLGSILWGHCYPLFQTSDDCCPWISQQGWIDRRLCSFVTCAQWSMSGFRNQGAFCGATGIGWLCPWVLQSG